MRRKKLLPNVLCCVHKSVCFHNNNNQVCVCTSIGACLDMSHTKFINRFHTKARMYRALIYLLLFMKGIFFDDNNNNDDSVY